ncbi:MAG: hypothetical protein IJ313_09290 [Clostridia bacterium]|nr:hypothetical protein [Clostridia bacterium]
MLPKEECEVLLDALLAAAENLLRKNGEFYPIGAVMTADSDTAFTAAHSDNEFPDSQSVIDALISSHKQMAEKNEIKASGITWNASISTPDGKQSDAIIVSLEHKDDYAVIVGLPYRIGLFKKIKFGEIFAQSGNHNIF